MRKSTSASIALAGVLLAGCGSQYVRAPSAWFFPPPPLNCNQANCPPLVVDVTQACPPSMAVADYVMAGTKNERVLTWEISGPYQFSRANYKHGIYVLGETIGDRVKSVSITENGKQLVMRFDRQADGRKFDYKLNLRHETSRAWCEIDPWIVDAL